MPRAVKLRKSTRIWLLVFGISLVAAVVLHEIRGDAGCVAPLATAVAIVCGIVLLGIGTVALVRAATRRLALRLALSYFLIGIVPIPLLALLLFAGSYVVAHQIVATRVRREVDIAAFEASQSPDRPALRSRDGVVISSGVPWVSAGTKVPWAEHVEHARALLEDGRIWLAVAAGEPAGDSVEMRLVRLDSGLVRRIADRTGYALRVEAGEERTSKGGIQIQTSSEKKPAGREPVTAPHAARPAGTSLMDRDWIAGVYVEPVAAVFGPSPSPEENVVVFLATTSPRNVIGQVFAQGKPELGRIFWAVLITIAASLLVVYLVALAIAFTLVGTIARNVNRLTRATQAIAAGDFSVRVRSRSRDQIGDLTRSFDGMAESIERLLVETAEKQRLEGEIAAARTIQQKLLPPAEASLPGTTLVAHFQPVAEIGGDYYDYLPMPDGRTAIAVGDVSGHGLPTGLLVASAKSALAALLESGLFGSLLLTRLNELIHRSTDSRNYMTLAVLAYDAGTRRGELTNSGQLAPYRISQGRLEALSLPSFPLGVAIRSDFPTRTWDFSPGDRLVFVTDGFIEALGAADEPFGFERLESVLRSSASADPARMRDALLDAVARHTGGAPPEDDRTLVILAFA
jgi:serine phosphatase RsbU (regulator of sigma subunit)